MARPERTLTDGSPVTDDHRDIIESGPRAGQQKGYVVLSEAERAKGFVRPVRRSYRHLKCGVVTTMGQARARAIHTSTAARSAAVVAPIFRLEKRANSSGTGRTRKSEHDQPYPSDAGRS